MPNETTFEAPPGVTCEWAPATVVTDREACYGPPGRAGLSRRPRPDSGREDTAEPAIVIIRTTS